MSNYEKCCGNFFFEKIMSHKKICIETCPMMRVFFSIRLHTSTARPLCLIVGKLSLLLVYILSFLYNFSKRGAKLHLHYWHILQQLQHFEKNLTKKYSNKVHTHNAHIKIISKLCKYFFVKLTLLNGIWLFSF